MFFLEFVIYNLKHNLNSNLEAPKLVDVRLKLVQTSVFIFIFIFLSKEVSTEANAWGCPHNNGVGAVQGVHSNVLCTIRAVRSAIQWSRFHLGKEWLGLSLSESHALFLFGIVKRMTREQIGTEMKRYA